MTVSDSLAFRVEYRNLRQEYLIGNTTRERRTEILGRLNQIEVAMGWTTCYGM